MVLYWKQHTHQLKNEQTKCSIQKRPKLWYMWQHGWFKTTTLSRKSQTQKTVLPSPWSSRTGKTNMWWCQYSDWDRWRHWLEGLWGSPLANNTHGNVTGPTHQQKPTGLISKTHALHCMQSAYWLKKKRPEWRLKNQIHSGLNCSSVTLLCHSSISLIMRHMLFWSLVIHQ